jgi:hypothetical protein
LDTLRVIEQTTGGESKETISITMSPFAQTDEAGDGDEDGGEVG